MRYSSNDWDEILAAHGLDYFHMNECAHGVGAFKDIQRDARIEICRRLIGLTKLRAEIGIVVSLTEDDYIAVMPPGCNVDAYSFCAHYCMQAVMVWVDRYNFDGEIAYFFEAGHPSKKNTERVIGDLMAQEQIAKWFRYSSHSFVKKGKRLCGLCAADLLAWEWGAEYNNRYGLKRRPIRGSLNSLLELSHWAMHWTQASLRDYLAESTRATLGQPMQNPENIRRFVSAKGFSPRRPF